MSEQKLIDPPKTLQDRLRNLEWLAAGECPLYGVAANEIDSLRAQLKEAEGKLSRIQDVAAMGSTTSQFTHSRAACRQILDITER